MSEERKVAEFIADKLAAEEIEDGRERYAETGSIAHRIHDFVNANDLAYSPSDLTTRLESGEWKYRMIRRVTCERRRRLVAALVRCVGCGEVFDTSREDWMEVGNGDLCPECTAEYRHESDEEIKRQ